MNAYEPLTDAELEAMLTRLTARGRADGLDAAIMAAVDTTPQRRGPWVWRPAWRLTPAPEPRLVWMLAIIGLLVALVAGTLAVGSRLLDSKEPLPVPQRLPAFMEGMVTEEVEPGVFRVVNDGVRDLASTDAVDVVAGYDGGIWLLREQGFLHLGGDELHEWPVGSGLKDHVLEVAPDGTLWVIPNESEYSLDRRGEGLRSTGGEAWSAEPCPGDYCTGVTVAPDGTLWASWYDGDACHRGLDEHCSWWVGYLGPTGWQPLGGDTPADFSPPGFGRLFFTDAGDVYGVTCIWACALYHYEAGAWQRERDADMLVDVGLDGTVWQDGGLETKSDGLARLAGGAWEDWTLPDLLDIRPGLGGFNGQFEVAPDGSVWFSLDRHAPGTDTDVYEGMPPGRKVCDGLARFDGQTLDRFLPDQCIAMDIAADGSAWVLAGGEQGRELYVITPEAVAPMVPTSATPLPADAAAPALVPTEARAVFHWAGDDLGEWVTEDELADELAAMSIRQPFLAPLDGGVEANCTKDECEWSFHLVGDPDSWRLLAHNHGGAQDPWMTDPLLPQGATHARGWGHFFSGPYSDQSICITWERAGEYLDLNEVDYRTRYFALASLILRELGWAD